MGYLKAQGSSYYGPVLYGLAACFLLLGIGACVRWLASQVANARHGISIGEAKSSIRNILDKFGVTVSSLNDEGFLFHYNVVVNTRNIAVSQSKQYPQFLYYSTSVTYDDADVDRLRRTPGGLPAVLREIRIRLASYKISYAGVGEPLTRITLSKTDAITSNFGEYEFMRSLDEVDMALSLLIAIVDIPAVAPPGGAVIVTQ